MLGAADGAFLLQKEKRIANKAKLSITGRDQQDQCLHLEFNKQTLIWELTEIENELFPEPKDELIEKIASFFSEDNPRFEGTATELIELLGLDTSSNALSRKLNVSASKLYCNFSCNYCSLYGCL